MIDLQSKWSTRCWHCGKAPEQELKTCVKCKTAKYCGRECQKPDWEKQHRHLHREEKITRRVLADAERNANNDVEMAEA